MGGRLIQPKEAEMKPKRLTLALIVAYAAAASFAASATPSNRLQCIRAAGQFTFTSFAFTSATTAVGVGVVRGDVNGTFHAHYWDIQTGANGVTETRASHVLTTPRGTLVTLDAISLLPDTDPNSGFVRPDSRLLVVGGTGTYKDTTGLLRTSGRVNLTTLEGSIGFEGKICSRGGDDPSDDG
jgi:hypothetical protein